MSKNQKGIFIFQNQPKCAPILIIIVCLLYLSLWWFIEKMGSFIENVHFCEYKANNIPIQMKTYMNVYFPNFQLFTSGV